MKMPDWKSKIEATKAKITESAGDIVTAGNQKLREKFDETMTQISGLRPILDGCGFIIGDIYLTASITPSVGIIIEQKEKGRHSLSNIEPSLELSKFQKAVLSSIQKIYDLNDLIEAHNHTIGQLDISLGISPEVTAHLNSTKSRAFSTTEQNQIDEGTKRIEMHEGD